MSETVYPGALDNITPTEFRNSPSLASVLNAIQETIGITGAFNFGVPTAIVSGELGTDFTVTGSNQTLLPIPSLAIGNWVINFSGLVQIESSGGFADVGVQTAGGTAHATFTGASGSTLQSPTAGFIGPLSFSCVANVTVAGTMSLEVVGGGTVTMKAQNALLMSATGFTAIGFL